MTANKPQLTVPIPDRMRHLDRDRRGYPIPYVVLRDHEGFPHFTINDTRLTKRVLRDDLCSICGTQLFRGRWYAGGPACAFHRHGAYIDTPMHAECMRYAMQVCPYLALPNYGKRIDEHLLAAREEKLKERAGLAVVKDPTMNADRPPLFVAVMATGHTTNIDSTGALHYLHPHRPYKAVEFWRDGARLDHDEGMRIANEAIEREFNFRISYALDPARTGS